MVDLLSEKGVVIGATENTYGTDAVGADLAANNNVVYLAVNEGVQLQRVDDLFEPARLRAAHDGVAHTMIANNNTFQATGPLKAWRGGTSGNETPFYDWLLKACGFSEEVTDGPSAVYTLVTGGHDSASIYHYMRDDNDTWRLNYLTGGRGNMSFNFEVGSEATWTANVVGASSNDYGDNLAFFDSDGDPALDAGGSSLTYTGSASRDDADRNICRNITATVGGTTYGIANLTLDLAWTVTPKRVMTAAQSTSKVILTRSAGSRPNGTLLLMDGDTQYDDLKTKWKNGTELELVISLDDGTNDTTFNAPKMQFGPPTPQDVNGIIGWQVPFYLNGDWATNPIDGNSLTLTYQAGA